MSAAAQQAYFHPWNGGRLACNVPSCCEVLCYFVCDCWLHLTLRTPRYVKREPCKALACRQCLHKAGLPQIGLQVSRHEAYAWLLVRWLFTGHMLVEVGILGGRLPKADIWLPYDHDGRSRLALIIQVDGEHHTCLPMHGRSVARQQQSDTQFNAACLEQGHNLLRLHHADKAVWPHFICTAIQRCIRVPSMQYQLFTPSFAQTCLQLPRH